MTGKYTQRVIEILSEYNYLRHFKNLVWQKIVDSIKGKYI